MKFYGKNTFAKTAALSGILSLFALYANADDYYVKTLEFPVQADSITKIEMAARLVPTPKQLAWQEMELTAFMHFGVNTFTCREWGDGKEDPNVFNPTDLDCDQWVKTLKDAGFKMVLLTAKHHDGFCLWPTETTDHSVKSSKWRNGQGDVVDDLRKACDKYGMKLGLYLSPWDRNAECYGDSPKYNDMFVAQLTELLTRYGKVDEVWFDGACGEGPNGKKQEYDWARFKSTIETLQPDAVMAIMGDDVRWVGNERGQGRETEWSATAITPGILPDADAANEALGIKATSKDLGGRAIVAKAEKLHWWPSEVDVSIRPGWFYDPKQQPHSLKHLAEIYLNSVGRNSVLLLNVPPDTDGKIHDTDVVRLRELSEWIYNNFSNNLAVTADGLEARPISPTLVNAVVLAEDITKGQRVEEFDVLGLVGGEWKPLASGTTIGYKRIVTFDPTEVEAVKIDVKSQRAEPNLKPMELYLISMPQEVTTSLKGDYTESNQKSWKSKDKDAAKAFDGDLSTAYTASVGGNTLTVDMGQLQPVAGFVYTPDAQQPANTLVFKYKFEVSKDGKNWQECIANGECSNIVNNPIAQYVYLNEPVDAKYFRFTPIETAEGGSKVMIPEFGILVKK